MFFFRGYYVIFLKSGVNSVYFSVISRACSPDADHYLRHTRVFRKRKPSLFLSFFVSYRGHSVAHPLRPLGTPVSRFAAAPLSVRPVAALRGGFWRGSGAGRNN